MKKKLSLREIMEDDKSAYMKQLVDKFNKLHGDELNHIVNESLRTGKPYVKSKKQ